MDEKLKLTESLLDTKVLTKALVSLLLFFLFITVAFFSFYQIAFDMIDLVFVYCYVDS